MIMIGINKLNPFMSHYNKTIIILIINKYSQ